MEQQKKETAQIITQQPDGFVVNEWLEGRFALRDAPEKYLHETSSAQRLTVGRYGEMKTRAREFPDKDG
jgi:hypothetical protein